MLRAAGALPDEIAAGGEQAVATSAIAATATGDMHLYAARFQAREVIRSRTIAPPGMHLALVPAGSWRAALEGRPISDGAGPTVIAFHLDAPAPLDGLLDARRGASVFGLRLPWPAEGRLDSELVACLGRLAAAGARPLAGRLAHVAQLAVTLPAVPASMLGLHLQARALDLLLALGEGEARRGTPATRARHRRIADVAAEVLDAELMAPPDMVELARRLGTSVRVMRDAFRARHGVSPQTFLIERRLERARVLLLGTELGIAEVARLVGYEPASFSAAFTRRFGMAPTALRR